MRPERIERLLGLSIDPQQVHEILVRLGMAVAEDSDHWLVVPPAFRFDTIEADLIEEIGRIYGTADYLAIAPPRGCAWRHDRKPESARSDWVKLGATGISGGHYLQLCDPLFHEVIMPDQKPSPLANPISADLALMWANLWPGLIKAARHNQKRQQERIRLFESGLCFLDQGGKTGTGVSYRRCGVRSHSAGTMGRRQTTGGFLRPESRCRSLVGVDWATEASLSVAARHPALHPGQSARIE
ncbi:MAG: hypothetical protein R3F37_20420 [Candidatus Competibacteraceae bacterium]